MDNKYGLGSTKVATEHHSLHHKSESTHKPFASSATAHSLCLVPTMHDHRCDNCGEWQQDVPQGYSTGRSSDY